TIKLDFFKLHTLTYISFSSDFFKFLKLRDFSNFLLFIIIVGVEFISKFFDASIRSSKMKSSISLFSMHSSKFKLNPSLIRKFLRFSFI
mgnify:CR=1